MLNFIILHLNVISLIVWTVLFVVVLIKYIKPLWLGKISILMLLGVVIFLHILYAGFVTWAQYHVWSVTDEQTRFFLIQPLSNLAPLPPYMEWTRHYFEQPMGYFVFYVLGRVWLAMGFLFLVTGLFYGFLRFIQRYRDGFGVHGPELIATLLLIAGWPNVLLVILLGFIFAAIISYVSVLKNIERTRMENAFLITTPIVMLFGPVLFKALDLSTTFVL